MRRTRETSHPGQVLRSRREALSREEGIDITQEMMAARTGYALAQRDISRLEHGTRGLTALTVTRAVALARGLRWSLWDLQQATGVDFGVLPPDQEVMPFPVGELRTRYEIRGAA